MASKAATAAWWFLAALYPVWALLSILGWFERPQLGLSATPGPGGDMVITAVHPGGLAWNSGARSGDILLEIDGIEVDAERWSSGGDSGTEFRVMRARDGTLISDSLQPEYATGGLALVSFQVIGLAFVLTSSFMFLRSDRAPGVLAGSLLLLAVATALASAPAAARSQVWALNIERLILPWSTALFFVFFSVLHRAASERWTAAQSLRLGIVASAALLNILYLVDVVVLPEIHGLMRRLGFLHLGAGLLGGIGYLVSSYVRTESPVRREQLRIMVFGVSAAVSPILVLNILPAAIGLPPPVISQVTVLAFILVPLSFGYAIMRHQLMGIRRLVHRGAAYGLITIGIFTLYTGLIAVLGAAAGTGLSEDLALQVFILVVLFAALPFTSGVRRLAFATINRVLYQDFTEHVELTRQVSIDAARARNMDELASNVLGAIMRDLQLSFAAFLETRDGKVAIAASVGSVPEGLLTIVGDVTANGGGQPVSRSTIAIEPQSGRSVLVKLRRPHGDSWTLCLGPKVTEEEYHREDLEVAESLAGYLATIVEKLQLLDTLQKKTEELRELNRRLVDAQEEERTRIASYLHDDPLQEITNLIWRYSEDSLPAQVQGDLQRISESLRNFAARLHPSLLEDLGLVRALEWVGEQTGRSASYRFILETENVGRDDRFGRETELALYRIAQEALTNCQRHSGATNVWLRLRFNGNETVMSIEDDGVGLPAKPSLSPIKLGLAGMRERAEQMGGHLQTEPREPCGTKVVVSIPVTQLARASSKVN